MHIRLLFCCRLGSSARFEALITGVKGTYCTAMATHSMAQVAQLPDETAFMYPERLIAHKENGTIFANQ